MSQIKSEEMAEVQGESKSEEVACPKAAKKEECPLFYSNDLRQTLDLLDNYK